jgi:hypothetical protein
MGVAIMMVVVLDSAVLHGAISMRVMVLDGSGA